MLYARLLEGSRTGSIVILYRNYCRYGMPGGGGCGDRNADAYSAGILMLIQMVDVFSERRFWDENCCMENAEMLKRNHENAIENVMTAGAAAVCISHRFCCCGSDCENYFGINGYKMNL